MKENGPEIYAYFAAIYYETVIKYPHTYTTGVYFGTQHSPEERCELLQPFSIWHLHIT